MIVGRSAPRRLLLTLVLGAVGAAATLALVAAVGPGSASAAAWNNGTVFMHREPIPPNVGTACVERRIYLKQGRYRWKMYNAVNNYPHLVTEWTRYITLRSGRYLWKECLGAPTGAYQQCSWLDELANGIGNAASQCVWPPPARYGEGLYDFGSGLDWNPL